MKYLFIIISFFVTVPSCPLFALDFGKINIYYQYSEDCPIKIQFRLIQNEQTYTLFLSENKWNRSQGSRQFLLQKGYSSEIHNIISPTITLLDSTNNENLYKIIFSEIESLDLLIIQYKADNKNYFFDIPLQKGKMKRSFLQPHQNQNLIISHYSHFDSVYFTDPQPNFITVFHQELKAAHPPMAITKPLISKIVIDTLIQYSDFRGEIRKDKLYFFHQDTIGNIGMYLLPVPTYFPKLGFIHEQILPLQYITSSDEFNNLTLSTNPIQAFQNFWITNSQSLNQAKENIKFFFKRVENANVLFTQYQLGWTTDRGMIYIVFGEPLEVYRNDSGEEWIYENTRFTFINISTFFDPIMALKRDTKFEDIWYEQIRKLRNNND